jgi:hypothetical protein
VRPNARLDRALTPRERRFQDAVDVGEFAAADLRIKEKVPRVAFLYAGMDASFVTFPVGRPRVRDLGRRRFPARAVLRRRGEPFPSAYRGHRTGIDFPSAEAPCWLQQSA